MARIRVQSSGFAFAGPVLLPVLCWSAGAEASVLAYHPVTPCRIIDTRASTPQHSPNPLVAGAIRTFDATGTDMRHQGGAATSCGLPPVNAGDTRNPAEAVAVSLVVVDAAGPGNLRVFQGYLGSAPLASVINYVAGQTIAVGTQIPLSPGGLGNEFRIQADVSGAHVVVDVLGYYSRSTSTTFTSRIVGLPPSGVSGFAAISGVGPTVASPDGVKMRVSPNCTPKGFRVFQNFTGGSNGNRFYQLKNDSNATLAGCFTVPGTDSCGVNDGVLSIGASAIHIVTFSTGTVSNGDAMISFDLSCE